jgi:hypothetical protein
MVRGNGITEEAWIDGYRAGIIAGEPLLSHDCFAPRAKWKPVTIDGRIGELRTGCGVLDVVLFVDDRVYNFGAYGESSSKVGVSEEFRAMFMAWLSTISLDPAAALEDPASSSARPMDSAR